MTYNTKTRFENLSEGGCGVRMGHALEATATGAVAVRPIARPPVVLHGRGLLAARLFFALFAATAIWFSVTGVLRAVDAADGLWLAGIGDAAEAREANAAGGPQLAAYLAVGGLFVLQKAVFSGVALLLVRRSREVIAFLVAIFLIAGASADFPPNLFELIETEPVRASLGLFVTFCFPLTFVLLFYVFPDGRFTPRWTILPAALLAGSLGWTFFVARSMAGDGDWRDLVLPAVVLLSIVAAQGYRFRRVSGPVERQQIKWFLGGVGVALLTFVGGNILLTINGAFEASPPNSVATVWAFFEVITTLTMLCVPLGLGVAVLRYRLFAIDVIFNRALVYGSLTACIVAFYILIVGYLGALFRTHDAGDNLVISLVATGVVAVLFQPLRERLQRAANRLLYGERAEPYAVLTRLGRQLQATLAPDAILPAIVATVANALKLPYAAIVLRDGEATTVAAAFGADPADATEIVPLIYQGEQVGELRLAPRMGERALAPADRRLVDDLAREAGVAVHAVRLTHDLQQARARLVAAREEERRRLRRDLHDGLGPALASQALTADTAALLANDDAQAAAALMREVKAQAQATVAEIRRVAYALRPPSLDDLGLVGALREAASRYAGAGLEIAVEAPEPLPPLPAAVEVAIYRIAQEALTNVVRHARARHCRVRLLAGEGEVIELVVADDGIGIPAGRQAGVGLVSMRERAEELGGSCTVEPDQDGGTRVAARLPLR